MRIEAKVRKKKKRWHAVDFEVGGRDHGPRKVGGFQKLEKVRK